MWMLRRGKRNRWQSKDPDVAGDVKNAARDLILRPNEDGLSVYAVADDAEAKLVAAAYTVIYIQEDPNDWIMLPEECIQGSNCVASPDADLPTFLRDRHHLVSNFDANIIARRALQNPDLRCFRQRKADIGLLVGQLLGAEEIPLRINSYWKAILKV